MTSTLLEQIEAAANDSKLARNIRGRVEAAARCLPIEDQKSIVVDWAEHIVWICEIRSGNDPRFRAAIDALRSYLAGNSSLQNVDRARNALVDADNQMLGIENHPTLVMSTSSACAPIKSAVNFVCYDDWKKSGGVILGRTPPKIHWTAEEACSAAARYQGGDEWNCSDEDRRRQARARGRDASDVEAAWQLQRIIEYAKSRAT